MVTTCDGCGMVGHTDAYGRRTGPCVVGINFTGHAGDVEALERLRRRERFRVVYLADRCCRLRGMTNDIEALARLRAQASNGVRKVRVMMKRSGWWGIYTS